MKNKRIWIALSILLALALLIGGCAKTPTTTTPTATTPTATTPKPTTPTATTPKTTAPTPTQTEVIKWRGQTAYAIGTPWDRFPSIGGGAVPYWWLEWIKANYGDRLQIDLAPPSAIVPTLEVSKAVSEGTLDICNHYGSYHAGRIPEGDIECGLVMAWQSGDEVVDAYFNLGLLEAVQEVYRQYNLYYIPTPLGMLYNTATTFDPSTPEAYVGKKVRAVGAYADYIQAIGGSPLQIPGEETYMALKLGTIDGSLEGIVTLEATKLKEVVGYYVVYPNLNAGATSMLINLDSWNALPADIREGIEANIRWAVTYGMTQFEIIDQAILRAAAAVGVEAVRWSEADVLKVVQLALPIWDKVAAKSASCARLVEMIKDEQRVWGRM